MKRIIPFLVGLALVSAVYFYWPSQPRPNIVLISIDSLRADHLGCYGYQRNTSPNIDALAREGILFENALTQAGFTLPSFVSLFTSQYARENQIAEGTTGILIPEGRTTLPEYLKKAGYRTYGFTDGGFLRKRFGFDQGFDDFVYDTKKRRGLLWKALPEKQKKKLKEKESFRDYKEEVLRSMKSGILDENTLEETVYPWLEQHRGESFFLFLYSLKYVHGPYEPPSPYDQTFLGDALYKGKRQVSISEFHNHEFSTIPGYQNYKDSTDIDGYVARYDGEIRYMDKRIGDLVGKLRELDILDNTIFIFTSDHGESLDEHEWYLSHTILYDSVLRIPLILRYPNGLKGGERIRGYAHLIDVLPTILDLLEIPLPEETIRGKSLVPLITGKNDVNPVSYSAYGIMNSHSIREGKWKLIYRMPRQAKEEHTWKSMPGLQPENRTNPYIELFDLEQDPGELHNLAADSSYREKAMALFKKLKKGVDFSLKDSLKGKKKQPLLDECSKAQLKMLGYVVD